MAASIPANCNPRMLEWARVKAGFTREQIATAEKILEKTLAGWESGSITLSLARARKLAKRYKYPLMVFYLEAPPTDFSVVRDFRLLADGSVVIQSPELRYALRFAQEQQAWAASYLEEAGEPKCEIVGCAKLSQDTAKVGQQLRALLSLSLDDQRRCSTDSAAFKLWRDRCEDRGIFVFRSSRIPLSQMRGCALSNHYAPVALVNGRDSFTARNFTLAHEIAHIALGLSAISGGPRYFGPKESRQAIERFCNRVAAEILVPVKDFVDRIPQNWKANDETLISDLARRYWVSRSVIGMRLVETGFANRDYLKSKWPIWNTKRRDKKPGRPTQPALAISRNGDAFVRLAIGAYRENSLHGGELSTLLRMKLKYLPALETILYPSRIQTTLSA